MSSRRTFMHAIAAGLFARPCSRWPFWKERREPMARTATPANELVALTEATTWINSAPLSEASLQGKVVLVQFCTYSCINWLRTLPYIRGWSEQYRELGLLTVGVHTPEFGFEHDAVTVRGALGAQNVQYPVALDNAYQVWRAFSNHYWPALYLYDSRGRLQYRHFGEGEYDQTEAMLRVLLTDAGGKPAAHATPRVAHAIEAAPDWSNLRSPENYLGYSRTGGFAPPGGIVPDQATEYALPRRLRLNQWSLEGAWTAGPEHITSARANSRLLTCFHGRDLHLVMGPPPGASPVRFRVTLDGAAPGAAHGFDIDAQGDGIADGQRLYQLIRQPVPIADRVLQIEFRDPGIEAYAFTFG